VTSQSNQLQHIDEPLRRIVLIPLDGIAVIHRELVVKVMVTFTDGYEGSGKVVPWCMLVIKGSLSKPVSERIDAESRL
jgi:hypothetical protein